MNHKLQELIKFFERLRNIEFTGQVRVNFHKGSISDKIEKKGIFQLRSTERDKVRTIYSG